MPSSRQRRKGGGVEGDAHAGSESLGTNIDHVELTTVLARRIVRPANARHADHHIVLRRHKNLTIGRAPHSHVSGTHRAGVFHARAANRHLSEVVVFMRCLTMAP